VLEQKPCNVRDAICILRRLLRPEELEVVKHSRKCDLARFHFNHGEYIRNLWVHRGGSPLTRRIMAAGGSVGNGDDFSQLIMEALWHDLNDEPYQLEASAHYQRIMQTGNSVLAGELWAANDA
jgi:hypothetical protein